MNITSHKPEVHYRGQVVKDFDALIQRIGASITSSKAIAGMIIELIEKNAQQNQTRGGGGG